MQGHVHKSLAKVALARRRAPHGGDKPHAARYSHAQQETRHCQRHLRRLLRTPRPHVTEQPPHSATFHSKQESGTVIAHGLLVGGRSVGQRELSARLSSASRQLIDLADVPASEQADGAVHADQLEVGTQPIPLQSRSTHGSDVGGTSMVLLHSIDGVVGRPGMYGDTHINCTANELRSKSPSRSSKLALHESSLRLGRCQRRSEFYCASLRSFTARDRASSPFRRHVAVHVGLHAARARGWQSRRA